VLAVVLINTTSTWPDGKSYNFLDATLNGMFSGAGFTFVLLLMAGIRERLEYADLPESMKGFAIGLILASTMALSFWGFMGFKM
jgi:electron transport complex protein RnfA